MNETGEGRGRPRPFSQADVDEIASFQGDCVDNVNTLDLNCSMSDPSSTAEVNIHLRARSQDRTLIDQAAELVGTNRSQFMMTSALKEAKNILLDQSTIFADAETFQKVMDWMDGPASPSEAEGMKRLLQARAPWDRG